MSEAQWRGLASDASSLTEVKGITPSELHLRSGGETVKSKKLNPSFHEGLIKVFISWDQ